MARLIYTEGFLEDMLLVELPSKRSQIMETVGLLERFPELGSAHVRTSMAHAFGRGVRKLPVSPFFVVYEYHEAKDEVVILGLMPQRLVR